MGFMGRSGQELSPHPMYRLEVLEGGGGQGVGLAPHIVQGPQEGGGGWSYPATHERDTMIWGVRDPHQSKLQS